MPRFETMKASRGRNMGKEYPSQWVWGSIVISPSGVWGKALLILCILSSTERISDRQKRQNDQLHFDQLLELQHILMLNRDKFGTGFGIRHNSASRMTSYFWGQALKIRDCPEKKFGRMVTLGIQYSFPVLHVIFLQVRRCRCLHTSVYV